jgi:hypothetical protein
MRKKVKLKLPFFRNRFQPPRCHAILGNRSWRANMSFPHCFRLTLAFALPLLAIGCNYGPSRIEAPSISPAGAADAAMEMHDADGDGFLAGEELDKVPGVKAAMQTVDTNGDSKVSAGEIAERIRAWQASQIGVATIMCVVTMDGRPLEGATVTFEPESFLGDEIQAGSGKTDYTGSAYPRIPKEKRPVPDMPGGLQLGFYRVEVSKMANGKETIPGIYNSETTLGQQIAPDDPAFANQRIRLELTSR